MNKSLRSGISFLLKCLTVLTALGGLILSFLTSKDEGYKIGLARLFAGVAKIEKEHEERYKKLLKNIEDELVFSNDGDTIWVCRNCGHVVVGKKAPKVCPVCEHPQSYFERKANNY
jgi:rubrerythrin